LDDVEVAVASSFDNKVVLVTGAHADIGEGAASAFSKAGARVFGIVRRADAHEAARSRHPRNHWLLAPDSVRVNAITPGRVDTPIFETAVFLADAISAVKASFTKGGPLGRRCTVEEVARWIVAAADPAAAGVTGQVLSIDGGMSLT
jgi:NAD(P)-dependent dehydrogenase (short-subunit alcohol dehydrogenase family)